MSSTMRFDTWQDSNGVTIFNGAGGVAPSGFTASSTITATNASWPVPTLKSPIVKVTVIGGGGGGPSSGSAGGAGGTTTFNAGGAGTVTAAGGAGGSTGGGPGVAGHAGLASANGGGHGGSQNLQNNGGFAGQGGKITVAYLNLTGISTVNVTIGAGGTAGSGSPENGHAGGRGEVIVEYVAG